MGIKRLNKFIKVNCSDSLSTVKLSDLRNKTIVIDTSIYLYRFISDGSLIENIYLMVSLFKKYNITPIFVFDGKPPLEKQNILLERSIKKAEAKNKYEIYKKQMENTTDINERHELDTEMTKLKKKFIYIKNKQVTAVKELLDAMGVCYFKAEGEADNLCAWLTIKKKAYACLSEDMDMFVYGCPRILRYFSIHKEKMIMYDTKQILKQLQLKLSEFRELCVLSGSDYNNDINNKTIYYYYSLFKKYRENNDGCFYDYLYDHDENINYTELLRLCDMFNINHLNDIKLFQDNNKEILNKYIKNNYKSEPNIIKLREILKNDGFIFLDTIN